MKSRQVVFYLKIRELPELMKAVREQVLVRYEPLPHFRGMTVIKSDAGERAQVIVTSFWVDGLEGSDEEATRFINQIRQITGANPSRLEFDTLYAHVKDSDANRSAGGTFGRVVLESGPKLSGT